MEQHDSEDLVLASSKCSQHYYTVLAVFQLTRLRLKSCRSDLHRLITQRCEDCIQENLPLDLLQWRGKLAVLMHQPNHLLRTHLFRPQTAHSTSLVLLGMTLALVVAPQNNWMIWMCHPDLGSISQFACLIVLILPFHRANQAKDLIPKSPHSLMALKKTTPSGVMIKYLDLRECARTWPQSTCATWLRAIECQDSRSRNLPSHSEHGKCKR